MSDSVGRTTAVRGIPVTINLALALALALVHVAVLVLVPLGLLTGPAAALVLVAAALLSTPMWALIHECIHGLGHPARAINLALGRALSIVHGAPFRLLRHGHLHHHRTSRGPGDRAEVFDPAEQSVVAARLAYYARLLGGLYLLELAANLLLWLPRRLLYRVVRVMHPGSDDGREFRHAERELLAPAALRELRTDAVGVLAVYGGALWSYGAGWWLLALVLAWRALSISLLDNSFHYATPLDDRLYATNLRLPDWAARAMLNFNMHRTHHRHVATPWVRLPDRHEYAADDCRFVAGVLRQLRGPIPLGDAQLAAHPVVNKGDS